MINATSGISCTQNIKFTSGINAISGIKATLPLSYQAFYPFSSDLIDQVSGNITASFANAPTFGGGGINTVANTDITVPTTLDGGDSWDASGDFTFGYTGIGKTVADVTGQVLLQTGNMGISTGIGITFAEIGASISSLPVDSDDIIGECFIKYIGGMLSIVIDGVESTPVASAPPTIGNFAQIGANIANASPAPGTYGGLLFEAVPVNLGPELQANFDMSQGLLGWTGVKASVAAVTDMGVDAVLITSTDTGDADRGELAISGLTIGRSYRVSVIARRGIGVDQVLSTFTWCTITNVPIASTNYFIYNFDVVATATSGVSRVFASKDFIGGTGDTVFCSRLSIKEIL